MYTESQYEEFEKRMVEAYPKMFAEPYGGFAVGPGWWPILETLCSQIQHHIDWKNKKTMIVPQVNVAQIKEKFGGLRFYYDGGDEYISGLVSMAESWAACSCETCGTPGERREGGWIRTLCDTHETERQSTIKERFADKDLQKSILEAMQGEAE
jgi:hypothetical protein